MFHRHVYCQEGPKESQALCLLKDPHLRLSFGDLGKRLLASLQETGTPASVPTSPTGTARSGSPFETALDSRATLEHRLRSTPRTYRAFGEPGSPPSGQRMAVAWQEVEELECPVASSQVSRHPFHSCAHWMYTQRLPRLPKACACCSFRPVRVALPALSIFSWHSPLLACELRLAGSQALRLIKVCVPALQGGERSVVLQPGQTRLSFRVTVLKQGVYTLKYVQARLGRLSLRLRSALPEEKGPPVEMLTAGALTLTPSDAQTLAPPPAIGEIDSLGGQRLLMSQDEQGSHELAQGDSAGSLPHDVGKEVRWQRVRLHVVPYLRIAGCV